MAVLTAGVVLAARPASTPASADHHSNVVDQTPREGRAPLAVPADLLNHRLKIRMDRSLGARLLPDGRLFSLKHRDLSAISDMFHDLDVHLSPVTKVSEDTITQTRLRAQAAAGGSFADLGATFWVDGPPASMGTVARQLHQLREVESIEFKRQSEPVAYRIHRDRPERPTGDATPDWTPGDWRDDAAETTVQTDVDGSTHAWNTILAEQAERSERQTAEWERRNEREGFRGGGECCFYVKVNNAGGQGPGWVQGHQSVVDQQDCTLVVAQAEQDAVLNDWDPTPGLVPTFIQFNDAGTACGTYGACCTSSDVRGGSDQLGGDCGSPLVFQAVNGWRSGVAPTPPSTGGTWTWDAVYVAYDNCNACRLRVGTCCFPSDTVGEIGTGDFEASLKFQACDTGIPSTSDARGLQPPVGNWPPAHNSSTTWAQPDIDQLALNNYTGEAASNGVNLMPSWQGFGLEPGADPWEGSNPYWKNSAQPATMMVIGGTRLVTNTDELGACEACVALGGVFAGNVPMYLDPGVEPPASSYPTLLFDGEFTCGIDGSGYDASCEGDIVGIENYLLGACAFDGGTEILSLEECNDEASSRAFPGGQANPLWVPNMINPQFIVPDPVTGAGVHAIHGNAFRPTWALWFTPYTNSHPAPLLPENDVAFETWCPPVNPGRQDAIDPLCEGVGSPEFLVPAWEYIGTYVEWTGWDPERWWTEITDYNRAQTGDPNWEFLGLTLEEFLVWFPPMDGSAGLLPAPLSTQFTGVRNPGHYGDVVSFGVTPTCTEFEGSFGLATQRGEDLPWDDLNGDSLWPVYPGWGQFVYHWQMDNSDAQELSNDLLYPFNEGWNRWQTAIYLFDYGQPTPYPVFHGLGRYLNGWQPGTTEWLYQGDQTAPPETTGGNSYVWPYLIADQQQLPTVHARNGNPVYGSCFFPHSARFPTLLGTEDNTIYPGEQECVVSNFCDDGTETGGACCDSVATQIARCCTSVAGTETWDAECVQLAVNLYLADQGDPAIDYADYTCRGITPFLSPVYPDWETYRPEYEWPIGQDAPESILGYGVYNPDPRNVVLNPYLDAVLPQYIDPTYTSSDTCTVADVSPSNSLDPGSPVPPDNAAYDSYNQIRHQAGRLYQFMPRCQGIFSSAGQCNVPGSESGRSAWDAIADDENLLIGCQDFDCCMRVISTLLQEKDQAVDGSKYSDREWINFGHMGVTVTAPKPPLSGQWTPYMAATARRICYPAVESGITTPDFFPLQLHAGVQAYQQNFAGPDSTEWIEGPNGGSVSSDDTLRQLIYAPFSWVDPTEDTGTLCLPAHQNIYEMCPRPYYTGNGLGIWPAGSPFEVGKESVFETFTSGVSYLNQSSERTIDPFGEGITIAVVGESAWLQSWTPPMGGPVQGAVHEDLGNVILEGPDMGLPEVTLDFSDEEATSRITAMLGVIAATDNGIGVTGIAHNATTYFFPTRAVPAPGLAPQERFEDAFLHALSVLQAGDILLLATESTTADGFMLSDTSVQPLVELAASAGIHVILPAGDRATALPTDVEIAGSDNVSVIGAAVPASEQGYLRWWSSNYSAEDTNSSQGTLQANLAAWGGGVATTGGNANLTLLTIDGAATEEVDGTYTLTQTGRAQSYTNDFGARIDGSFAAAAQIAASSACAQGVMKALHGDPLIPAVMLDRMFTTALDNADQVRGQPRYGTGQNPPGASPGDFTWDMNQEATEARFVGRIPNMGRLLENLIYDVPDDSDFIDEIPFRIIRMDVIEGIHLEGTRFSVDVEGDDEYVGLRSVEFGPGFANVDFYLPGPVYYGSHRDITDVMFTCVVADDYIPTSDFGVYTSRVGPAAPGEYAIFMFDFPRNAWRKFVPDDLPADQAPDVYTAQPYPFAPIGINRYREPGSRRIYVRVLTWGFAQDNEPYQWYLDFLDFTGLLNHDHP